MDALPSYQSKIMRGWALFLMPSFYLIIPTIKHVILLSPFLAEEGVQQ